MSTRPTFSRPLRELLPAFGGALWDSLKGVPTIIGLIATLVTFNIGAESTVSARWAVLLGLVLFALVVALLETVWRAFKEQHQGLPRVVQARRPASGSYPVLVLLEPSDLYSFGDLVTFYHIGDDQFESLIGLGAVLNVQQDGMIQAIMQRPIEEQMELVQRLANNEEAIKRKIRVKLNVQRGHTLPAGERQPDE